MPIVAGVDFGTLSVRVTLLDSDRDSSGKVRGRLGTATAEYPLHRRRDDPDYATQSHDDQMDALVKAMRAALDQTAVRGGDVVALALDTTGSSVVAGRRRHAAALRVLPLVRPSREERGAADHSARSRREARGDCPRANRYRRAPDRGAAGYLAWRLGADLRDYARSAPTYRRVRGLDCNVASGRCADLDRRRRGTGL